MATLKQIANKIGKDLNESYPNIQNLFDVLKRGFKEMEDVSGGGGGGSTVSWDQLQVSGTKIAEIDIDGNTTNVYAPASQTIAVSQIQTTGTKIASISLDGVETDIFAPTSGGGGGSVSVTADGVKTNSQLLDEIFALIDMSKLSGKSAFSIIGSASTECFNISSFNAARCVITNVAIQSNAPVYSLIIARASASIYGEYVGSYSDISSTVVASGTKFKIEY